MFGRFYLLAVSILIFTVVCSAAAAEKQIKAHISASALKVELGQRVHFDGTDSRPGSGGELIAMFWDFNDMDQVDVDAMGDTVSHWFNHTGAFRVTLVVENERGERDKAQVNIEVFPPAGAGLSITDSFEGGRTGLFLESEETFAFRLEWGNQFYFRLDNVKGKPVSLRIVGYGPGRPVPGSVTPYPEDDSFDDGFELMVNTDYQAPDWQVLSSAEYSYDPDGATLTVRFTPAEQSVYLAWAYPYTMRSLEAFIDAHEDHPDFYVDPIGLSVEGRPIYQLTISDGSVPEDDKKVVWITAIQHAYEMAGGPVCEGLAEALLARGSEAAEVRKRFVFHLVPLVNPDGVARGGYRYNMHDVDLNRNWDDLKKSPWDNAIAEPEVAAVKRSMRDWVSAGGGLDMFFDFHCFTTLEDTMALYMARWDSIPPGVVAAQERFAELFSKRWDWRASASYSPGCANCEVSVLYSGLTGVLCFTPEHALGLISRPGGKLKRNTPAQMRRLGADYLAVIREFFNSESE